MPLRLVRSPSNRTLWDTCADRFLAAAAGNPGPGGHRAHLWITQRSLRDSLLERAFGRGVAGWLDPPIAFFSELPERFELRGKPVGLLTRRRTVARLASRHAERLRIGVSENRGIIRGHMMDGVLGELLPEGIHPDHLSRTLAAAADDEFARRRNEWVGSVYRDYVEELRRLELYDPRSVHALVAASIERGDLRKALGGASELHIYGLHTLRSRERLIAALAAQPDVEVSLYTVREEEPGEWDDLARGLGLETEEVAGDGGPTAPDVHPAPDTPPATTWVAEQVELDFETEALRSDGDRIPRTVQPAPDTLREPMWGGEPVKPGLGSETRELGGDTGPIVPVVQPAPDTLREYAWVAEQVKRALAAGGIEPHEIAVIAREGRDDTRRAYTALQAAGVPCTARMRMQLSDIGALKALLELFRGAATDWSYRTLRNVLSSPYFRTRIDLRSIDRLAGERRLTGLDQWAEGLRRLAAARQDDSDPDARDLGAHAQRLAEDAEKLRELATQLAHLPEDRTEAEWVELTLRMVTEGILGLRRRASRPVGSRWDVVRFDQRGLRQLERLLREWAELDLPEERLSAAEWHRLLQRLLEAHELVLSTPGQKGVQVIEAHDAALVPFRAVFVTHANDGEFPRAASSGGVLLEEERAALRRAGLPLSDRELNLRRERTLWRAAVQATERVTITYRTTDPAGTPLLPSLMVPEHDPANELPRSFEPVATEADAREHVVSPEQERRLAAVRLRQTAPGGGLVLTADLPMLQRAIVAANAEVMRGVRDRTGTADPAPNPWQGELRDPVVLDRLSERYGPEHVWSVSQLESYSTCPFIFLVDRVLWLRPTEEAEEETTALTFGGIAHDLLQRFYQDMLGALPASFDSTARQRFDELADQLFRERLEEGSWLGLPTLWRHTSEEIRARVHDYLTWELPYLVNKGERPVWCELELRREGEPLLLVGRSRGGARQTIRFTGRIDRVDVQGSGATAVHHVLDYKTSNIPALKGYEDGSVLQAPLYLLALAELKGVTPGKGRYRAIKKPGKPANGCEAGSGDENYDSALGFAFSIPARVRAGLFEPAMARTQKWQPYHPGIEVTRTREVIAKGSRFDA